MQLTAQLAHAFVGYSPSELDPLAHDTTRSPVQTDSNLVHGSFWGKHLQGCLRLLPWSGTGPTAAGPLLAARSGQIE